MNHVKRDLKEIYKQIILDHYAHPRGCRDFSHITMEEKGHNVSCGDKVQMKIDSDGNLINNISICSSGCAICVSSGSILYGQIKNNSIDEALKKIDAIIEFVKGSGDLPDELNIDSINSLAGIRKFPARVKCALLPWLTAHQLLEKSKK